MKSVEIEEIWERRKVLDKLYARYRERIENNFYPPVHDWEETEDEHGKYLCSYLGSIMDVFPSGKFYMPWTTNQTVRDIWQDRAFGEALEDVLEGYGIWVESGEGDPTELFICTLKETSKNQRKED